MTPETLADVRKLIGHLPAATRDKETWRYVAARLYEAARGADVIDAVALLRIVLAMEGVACRLE